jgi:hypothetical protein
MTKVAKRFCYLKKGLAIMAERVGKLAQKGFIFSE